MSEWVALVYARPGQVGTSLASGPLSRSEDELKGMFRGGGKIIWLCSSVRNLGMQLY